MSEFEECIKKRRLIKIKATSEMIQRELDDAAYDLCSAHHSYDEGNYKWAVVQSYYSMFHAAKALVLNKGYREKSHRCLLVALKELYSLEGEDAEEMTDNLELCMHLRHEADYGLSYTSESAHIALKYAEDFLSKTKKEYLKIV